MKKILFITLCVLSSLIVKSQDIEKIVQTNDGLYTLSNVETVEGMSQKSLFNNAVLWISETYKNPASVIQVQDSENGIIVIKGIVKTEAADTEHKLLIQVKDGRYKWEISDIKILMTIAGRNIVKTAEEIPRYNKMDDVAKNKIYDDFKVYINSLLNKMSEVDDW